MNSSPAISVQGLKKSYGDVHAVKGIDFEIQPGEVFGLLGPNGAGKTTTVEILEGLRPRSGGQVTVLGFDPDRQRQQLKDRIGVCLQATNLPAKIRVREAMQVFASFYSRNVDVNKLLQRLQLEEKRDAFYETLSGGQKQRLALALALINDPQLVFLDEPTTGLDPQVRVEIHKLLEELKREHRTILMTTHYIEEAERLCDRVAIVDEGRIVALDTPARLQQSKQERFQHRGHMRGSVPGESPGVGRGDPKRNRFNGENAYAALASSRGHAGRSGEMDRPTRHGIDRRQPETAQPGRCIHRTDRKEAA